MEVGIRANPSDPPNPRSIPFLTTTYGWFVRSFEKPGHKRVFPSAVLTGSSIAEDTVSQCISGMSYTIGQL